MSLEVLRNVNGFQVNQNRQWLESFTGFEAANAYAITDSYGNNILAAREEDGNPLTRWILSERRPFRMNIYLDTDTRILEFKRNFAFFKHNMDVFDSYSGRIGSIKWTFSVIRKKLEVVDASGDLRYRLATAPLSPWTFIIKNQYDQKVGTLTKKWSGLGLEMFTTSDNFGLILDVDVSVEDKALLLGAVILADFIHFEDKD